MTRLGNGVVRKLHSGGNAAPMTIGFQGQNQASWRVVERLQTLNG